MNNQDFGWALQHLKNGNTVSRSGWNGEGMWLTLIAGGDYNVPMIRATAIGLLPWIGMKTADNKFVPWLCSQTDMLAEDWGPV